MNYYEELGLDERASAEEIKDAYRSLMRLLHPDHVQDPELRRVADLQVKKLNKVYGVLSDAERRRRYDVEQQNGSRPAPIVFRAAPAPPPRKKLVTRSSALWVGAVSAFAVLLLWMASRQTPAVSEYSAGASIAEPQGSKDEPAALEPVPALKPALKEAPAVVKTTSSDVEAAQLRDRLAQVLNERDAALAEVARLRSQPVERRATVSKSEERKREAAVAAVEAPRPSVSEPAAPPVIAMNKTSRPSVPVETLTSAPPPSRDSIVGNWVYRPVDSAAKNKELYPPEFIETFISEDNGQVRGTYRARYHVMDRPVSPEVVFQFAGKLNGDAGSLPWSGIGGSRGEVTFRLMADHSLKVDWVASQLGKLGFYKGTAVLVKRAD